MDFARPAGFVLLVLVPSLALLAARSRAAKARDWAAIGRTGRPLRDRPWTWLAAIPLLVVALCGPRWGRSPGSDLPPGHDVVLLVDVSRSMGAEDAVPDRLGAAVRAAEGLVAELARSEGDRIAVVAFSGRGVLKCPLTEDPAAARDALRALRPGEVKPGGTDLGMGLAAAIDAFDDQEAAEGRTIVVLSDGEDHDNSWQRVVDRLRAARITVHAVAVGDSARGHTIPVRSASQVAQELRHRGQPILSRRDDRPLDAVREATGGAFVPMGTASADLASLYRGKIAPAARRRREAARMPERIDRYPAFAMAGLGLILATSWPSSRRVGLLAVLLAVGMGAGPEASTAAREVARGELAYGRGDFPAAVARFEAAAKLDPRSAIPRYNAAAALFRLGQFAQAEAHYREARTRADLGLRAKVDYALGNVAVARGRYKAALVHYDACLSSKAAGKGLATIRRDAATNRAFAAKLVPPPTSPDPEGDRDTPGGPRKAPSPDSPNGQERPGPGAGSGNGQGPPRPGDRAGGPNSQGPESPGNRLDAMLDDVRQAQKTQAEGPPPSPSSPGDRKDW